MRGLIIIAAIVVTALFLCTLSHLNGMVADRDAEVDRLEVVIDTLSLRVELLSWGSVIVVDTPSDCFQQYRECLAGESENLTDYQHIFLPNITETSPGYSITERGVMEWEPDPWLDSVGVDPDTLWTDEHWRGFLALLKKRLQQLEVEANVQAGRCI